jgi:hypothetical protein
LLKLGSPSLRIVFRVFSNHVKTLFSCPLKKYKQ